MALFPLVISRDWHPRGWVTQQEAAAAFPAQRYAVSWARTGWLPRAQSQNYGWCHAGGEEGWPGPRLQHRAVCRGTRLRFFLPAGQRRTSPDLTRCQLGGTAAPHPEEAEDGGCLSPKWQLLSVISDLSCSRELRKAQEGSGWAQDLELPGSTPAAARRALSSGPGMGFWSLLL